MEETASDLHLNFVSEQNRDGVNKEFGLSNEKIPRLQQVLLSIVPENEGSEEINKMTTDMERVPVYVVLDNDQQKLHGVINLNEQMDGIPVGGCSINSEPGNVGHHNGGPFINMDKFKGAEVDIQALQNSNSNLNLIENDQEGANLDDSNFNEENLLANLEKQVALQQHYLSLSDFTPDMDQNTSQPLGEIKKQKGHNKHMTSVNSNQNAQYFIDPASTGYSILPSLLHEPPVSTATWLPVTIAPVSVSENVTPKENCTKKSQRPGSILTNRTNIQYPEVMTSTPIGEPRIQMPGHHGPGRFVYTPHPKTGQLLYISEISDIQSSQKANKINEVREYAAKTPSTSSTSKIMTSTPNIKVDTQCRKLQLNSSGESESQSSPDPPTLPEHTPSSDESNIDKEKLTFEFSLINGCEEGRETHNLKERKRRARIKDACDVMRKLVPGMSDKTDKATVFEFAARYIHYLKNFVGSKHDKDFLLKYSPY